MQETKEKPHDRYNLRRKGVDGGGEGIKSALSIFKSGAVDEVLVLRGWEERSV